MTSCSTLAIPLHVAGRKHGNKVDGGCATGPSFNECNRVKDQQGLAWHAKQKRVAEEAARAAAAAAAGPAPKRPRQQDGERRFLDAPAGSADEMTAVRDRFWAFEGQNERFLRYFEDMAVDISDDTVAVAGPAPKRPRPQGGERRFLDPLGVSADEMAAPRVHPEAPGEVAWR